MRGGVVTLQSGQGVRPLSLRLGQNPAPLRGPWAFALAPVQAPALTAFQRFFATAVPLSFIAHGRDVAGRRAPQVPRAPARISLRTPLRALSAVRPLSDSSGTGYFHAFIALFGFHTVPVYYHRTQRVSSGRRPVCDFLYRDAQGGCCVFAQNHVYCFQPLL